MEILAPTNTTMTPEEINKDIATFHMEFDDLAKAQEQVSKDMNQVAAEALLNMSKGFEEMIEGLTKGSQDTIQKYNDLSELSTEDYLKLQEALHIEANLNEFKTNVNLYFFVKDNVVPVGISTSKNLILAELDKYKHYCRTNKLNYNKLDDIITKIKNVPKDSASLYIPHLKAFYYVLKYFNTNKKSLANRVLYIRLTLNMLMISALLGKDTELSNTIHELTK